MAVKTKERKSVDYEKKFHGLVQILDQAETNGDDGYIHTTMEKISKLLEKWGKLDPDNDTYKDAAMWFEKHEIPEEVLKKISKEMHRRKDMSNIIDQVEHVAAIAVDEKDLIDRLIGQLHPECKAHVDKIIEYGNLISEAAQVQNVSIVRQSVQAISQEMEAISAWYLIKHPTDTIKRTLQEEKNDRLLYSLLYGKIMLQIRHLQLDTELENELTAAKEKIMFQEQEIQDMEQKAGSIEDALEKRVKELDEKYQTIFTQKLEDMQSEYESKLKAAAEAVDSANTTKNVAIGVAVVSSLTALGLGAYTFLKD